MATEEWVPLLKSEDLACSDGEVVPLAQPLLARQELHHRNLAGSTNNPFLQACFETCREYFAPDNAQFFFQVTPQAGGGGSGSVCECCRTCDQLIYALDYTVFGNCIPTASVLRLTQSISSGKVRAGGAVNIKVQVRNLVRNKKFYPLTGLALYVSVPRPHATVTKAKTWPRRGLISPVDMGNASQVVWPRFDLPAGAARHFKIRIRISPRAPINADLSFEATVAQTNVANSPYCPYTTPFPAKVKVVA